MTVDDERLRFTRGNRTCPVSCSPAESDEAVCAMKYPLLILALSACSISVVTLWLVSYWWTPALFVPTGERSTCSAMVTGGALGLGWTVLAPQVVISDRSSRIGFSADRFDVLWWHFLKPVKSSFLGFGASKIPLRGGTAGTMRVLVVPLWAIVVAMWTPVLVYRLRSRRPGFPVLTCGQHGTNQRDSRE